MNLVSMGTILKRVLGVIFDCDDTILETSKTRWAALIATADSFHRSLDEITIRSSWGKPFDQLIAALVPDLDFSAFVAAYRATMRQYPPHPAPGAVALLNRLRSRSIRLDIITSSSRQLILQDLEAVELQTYFEGIWGYEETAPYYKPDPRTLEPVLETLSACRFQRKHILYIGDSVSDLQVARANSVDFIGVTSGLDDRSSFEAADLDQSCIVASLEELVDLV